MCLYVVCWVGVLWLRGACDLFLSFINNYYLIKYDTENILILRTTTQQHLNLFILFVCTQQQQQCNGQQTETDKEHMRRRDAKQLCTTTESEHFTTYKP